MMLSQHKKSNFDTIICNDEDFIREKNETAGRLDSDGESTLGIIQNTALIL